MYFVLEYAVLQNKCCIRIDDLKYRVSHGIALQEHTDATYNWFQIAISS